MINIIKCPAMTKA